MENRFLGYERTARQMQRAGVRYETRVARSPAPVSRGYSKSQSALARSLSADQPALVILIENGGIDFGIPELVDKILSVLPTSIVPESVRQQLITYLRDTIKGFTDTLIESADLALNQYGRAKPSLYDDVTVLRNGTA